MPIAKITGEGLAAIACAVALLWGCVLGEQALAKRAYAERMEVLRNSPHWNSSPRVQPVVDPSPHRPARGVTAEG